MRVSKTPWIYPWGWFSNAVTFAGHGDWRIPNIRELLTIVDGSVSNPTIDSVVFPNSSASNFLSASPYAGNSSNAWVVNFSNGYAGSSYKSYAFQVRRVRAGQSFNLFDIARPTRDYVDHADGMVTHTPTGLVWQSCPVGQIFNAGSCTGTAGTYTWDLARQLVSTMGGHTDWRLPTADELVWVFRLTVTGHSGLS